MNHHEIDIWSFVGAIIISIFSGIISILRRVANGAQPSLIWVVSEFLTAILCGQLMWSAYPHIAQSVPMWFTEPVAIASAALFSGQLFREMENRVIRRFKSTIK